MEIRAKLLLSITKLKVQTCIKTGIKTGIRGDVKIRRSLPLLASGGCYGAAAFCRQLK